MSAITSASESQAIKPGSFFLINAATKLAIGAKLEGNTPKWTVSDNQESWPQKWALEKSGLGSNGKFTYKLKSKATQTYLGTTGRDLVLSLSSDGLSFEFTQYEDGVCKITVPSKPSMVVELAPNNILQLAVDSTTPQSVDQNQRWTFYRDLKSVIPAGRYFIINKHTRTAIDLCMNATFKQDLTPIRGYPLYAGGNQQWMVEPGNEGYTIKNVSSGTYLGFRAGLLISHCMSVTANTNPVEFDIHGDPTKAYEIVVINKKSSVVLDLTGASAAPGTDVLFYNRSPAGNLDNQKWWFIPAPDYAELKPTKDDQGKYQICIPEAHGSIRLVNVTTGTSMDKRNVDGVEKLSGWGTDHVAQQKWVLVPTEKGYQVKHQDSGWFIMENNRQLVMGGGPGKEFLFDGNAESGYYMVDAASVNRYVTLEGYSAADKTRIWFGEGRADKWYLRSW